MYCARCHSLKIKHEDALDTDYCAECGSTDILEDPIEVWEQKYERKYGKKFAVRTEDPKKSFIFNLPIEKLKQKVYDSPKWEVIIKSMFPRFPEGYGKADSVILFFNIIVKQNRLEELKLLLFKLFKY